ncbi:hypothetical protein E0Z10_g146 [Xylaria hypoxylon]|uniref:Uncharacterized protein n=1 Tax=Xylaria hypoxylon TaxID=37992 RepID=A0A4Z0Z9U8_9PEZI|nr:hypothetical protein E0Z10_g146 [Xylaria hypoxylon]
MNVGRPYATTENLDPNHNQIQPDCVAMPIKWDDKSERDLLMAMRMAERGTNTVTGENWAKAANIMIQMGYEESTGTGISQRWSKVMQKDFLRKHPQALGNAAGAAAPGTTQAPAPTPGRRARGAAKKRDREQEQNEKRDDEAAAEEAHVNKKQKANA